MTVTLGSGWQRPVPAPLPAPEPDPSETLLERVLLAVEALRATFDQIPQPQVHVEPADFSAIVTAVQDLKGPGISAEDIAQAVKDALGVPKPPGPDPAMSQLLAALEKLDFRMKGNGPAFGASGPSNISDNPSRQLGVVSVTGTVPVSGTVATSAEEDMFGTAIVGSLNNLIEVHFDDPAFAGFLTITNTGAGAGSTQANGRVQFASGTTTTGKTVATTLDAAVYRPHFPTYAAFTAAFVTPPTGGTDLAILGLGDLTNGIFIGYQGTTFGILYRLNSVDTFIPKASWTNPTAAITATNGNIYKVEVGLFGYAGAKIRWWDPTARGWTVLHTIGDATAEPFFTNFDLPMTLQIQKNTSDATNVKINTACWGAGSSSLQGRMTDPITDRSLAATVRSVIVGKSTAGGTSYVPVKVNPSGTLTADVSNSTGLSFTDNRTLTERMLAKAPATGYTLWMDVTSTSATTIYLAEAANGTASSATGFRGIKVTLDANGNPLGGVAYNTSFVWDNRASATWTT